MRFSPLHSKHVVLCVALWILSCVALHAQSPVYSSVFELGGQVQTPARYTLSDLMRLAPTQANVTYSTTTTPRVSASYTGVLLWDLLVQAQIVTSSANKNDLLRHYVLITGSDNYQTIVSLGELSPDHGGQQVMVAYAQNGQYLTAATGGFARLIVPADKSGARDVSNVVAIVVLSPASSSAYGQAVGKSN